MSVRVMTAVWSLALPDSEKLVLLALADCANDEGGCWPSMATLTAKCTKSDRTIQAAIKSLVSQGHLTRNEVIGKGCSYIVHPRSDFAPKPLRPEETAPPKPVTPTPEAASDKPSRTIISSEANASSQRGSRIPPDWEPGPLPPTVAPLVAQWPPGREQRELEGFRDYWTARTRDAAKLNWNLTWHNRIRDMHDRIMRENRNGQHALGRHQPANDGLSSTTRAALRVFGACDEEDVPRRIDLLPDSRGTFGDGRSGTG